MRGFAVLFVFLGSVVASAQPITDRETQMAARTPSLAVPVTVPSVSGKSGLPFQVELDYLHVGMPLTSDYGGLDVQFVGMHIASCAVGNFHLCGLGISIGTAVRPGVPEPWQTSPVYQHVGTAQVTMPLSMRIMKSDTAHHELMVGPAYDLSLHRWSVTAGLAYVFYKRKP